MISFIKTFLRHFYDKFHDKFKIIVKIILFLPCLSVTSHLIVNNRKLYNSVREAFISIVQLVLVKGLLAWNPRIE